MYYILLSLAGGGRFEYDRIGRDKQRWRGTDRMRRRLSERDSNTVKAIMFLSLGLLLKRHLTPRNAGMSADVFLIR